MVTIATSLGLPRKLHQLTNPHTYLYTKVENFVKIRPVLYEIFGENFAVSSQKVQISHLVISGVTGPKFTKAVGNNIQSYRLTEHASSNESS